MSRLHNDISKMIRNLRVIEQFNNWKQLGGKEEIEFLKEKVNKLTTIKDNQELLKEYTWCAKMTNMFIDEIDPEFKRYFYQEEKKKEEEDFN
jgi:hypothetical protein